MTAFPTFLSVIRHVESRLNMHILTFEYEILSELYHYDMRTARELAATCRASSTAFFTILKKLEASGIIGSVPDEADKRYRRYHISDDAMKAIDQFNVLISQWMISKLENSDTFANAYCNYIYNIKEKINIRVNTCEYQIIMYLYDRHHLTNIEFNNIVDVSVTKFNRSLKNLEEMGLIYSERNHEDKRSKLYHLSDQTKQIIDEAPMLMLSWKNPQETSPELGKLRANIADIPFSLASPVK